MGGCACLDGPSKHECVRRDAPPKAAPGRARHVTIKTILSVQAFCPPRDQMSVVKRDHAPVGADKWLILLVCRRWLDCCSCAFEYAGRARKLGDVSCVEDQYQGVMY